MKSKSIWLVFLFLLGPLLGVSIISILISTVWEIHDASSFIKTIWTGLGSWYMFLLSVSGVILSLIGALWVCHILFTKWEERLTTETATDLDPEDMLIFISTILERFEHGDLSDLEIKHVLRILELEESDTEIFTSGLSAEEIYGVLFEDEGKTIEQKKSVSGE